MDENKKETLLYIIGFIFLLIYIYVLILFINNADYSGLLWICYISLPLMAISIFLDKYNLFLSQACLLFIPDLIWTLDFMYRMIIGKTLFGIKNYFFEYTSIFNKVLSFQHILTFFLILFVIILIKPKKNFKILLIGFFELGLFLLMGLFISTPKGINCLPKENSCFFSSNPFPIPYPFVWFIIWGSFILISYFILLNLFDFKLKKIYKVAFIN